MSRDLFGLENGIHFFAENGTDASFDLIFGSSAPGSVAQENNAGVGTLYIQTTGALWQKKTSGSGTDKWTQIISASILKFRNEKVVAVTGDAYPGDASVVTAFTDQEGASPAVNNTGFTASTDYAIFGAATTPVLAVVSATSGANITVTTVGVQALADGDGFIVRYYLPDSPASQESSALTFYNGSTIIKLSDVNWNFATGINLSGAYSASTGNPAAGDSVEAALQKIDANVDAIDSREGLAQGASNFGSFTGGQNILPNNSTAKNIFQTIATEIDTYKKLTGVTTESTLDSVLVDDFQGVEWEVWQSADAAPANKKGTVIHAGHNGTASADANDIKDNAGSILKLGTTNGTILVDLDGTGVNQTMRLRVSAPAAHTFTSRRRLQILTDDNIN